MQLKVVLFEVTEKPCDWEAGKENQLLISLLNVHTLTTLKEIIEQAVDNFTEFKPSYQICKIKRAEAKRAFEELFLAMRINELSYNFRAYQMTEAEKKSKKPVKKKINVNFLVAWQ